MRFLLLGIILLALGAAALTDDNEQVTGQGGRLLRYSSTQLRAEPSEEEMNAYLQARDRQLSGASLPAVLQAARQALQKLGYTRVEVDADYGLIQAKKNEPLVSHARQVLRGVLKIKVPLPAKPDHQSTALLLSLRPGSQPHDVLLRARIEQTVWDSSGNSRTMLDSDHAAYQQLFEQLDAALNARVRQIKHPASHSGCGVF
ncbi:hypothetical protein [Chromobacterium sphagni]|uniref:hypothetical protein n=1 Tax=Chromobacterium sphagni TaxID=1903179 RepID=UPI0009F2EBD9|nr:hypothetical protein [Chromobacterium sphagni]